MKVALDFVSPENVQECVRLAEESRLLPKNHRAKEDKLEVYKNLPNRIWKIEEILKNSRVKPYKTTALVYIK